MKIEDKLVTSVISGLKALYGQDVPAAQVQLQKTKKEFEGHLTLVVFPFLKMSKKGPEQTAQEIGEYLKANEPAVAAFNVIKGFLNLTVASATWIELLNEIHTDAQYGIVSADENAPLVMIEYSSPNTNKPLHLGHVRNNLLGNALANIVMANGNKVVKTNIVNDRGIHICKSMLAWQKYGKGETPESSGKKGDHLVGDYYVAFDKHYKAEVAELMEKGMSKEEAEAASPLMNEAREMLVKWEAGDPEVRALWQMMNNWVYAGFDETYRKMGVGFDKIYYESNTYLEGKEKVMESLETIEIQPIALGSTKTIKLGCILSDGSTHMISDDVRTDLFSGRQGFINTVNDNDPIRYKLASTNIKNYAIPRTEKKAAWVAWFIEVDGKRMYAASSDIDYKSYDMVNKENMPYGLAVSNNNGIFSYPQEKNSLFETYPGFSDWINGKVSSIGSFQKELVYKYCSGGIIGEDGKSHKIWDYLDLN